MGKDEILYKKGKGERKREKERVSSKGEKRQKYEDVKQLRIGIIAKGGNAKKQTILQRD